MSQIKYMVDNNAIYLEVWFNNRLVEVRTDIFDNGYISIDKELYKKRKTKLLLINFLEIYDEIVKHDKVSKEEYIKILDNLGYERIYQPS